MGALHDAVLAATTREQRHALRADAFAAITDVVTFTGARFSVTVLARPTRDGEGVRINVRITRNANGNDVTPSDLNPILIVNPPYLVEDAAGDVYIGGVRHREAPAVVLRGIIRDLLAARLG